MELESSYLLEQAEQLGFQDMQDYYESLLLSGKNAATTLAVQQYEAGRQEAEQKASYDISGAYANYLRQQRAIVAQGNLETGYKEEVGELLKQDYASAYAQAKETEATAITNAALSASETYSQVAKGVESSAEKIINQYMKQAQTKAQLYKSAEEYVQTQDPNSLKYEWYRTREDGYTELTKWGTEQFRKTLLQDGAGFKAYLEEEGLTDELSYYLSNAGNVHSDIFGFTETDYGISEASKLASLKARLEPLTRAELDKLYDEKQNQGVAENKTITEFYNDTLEEFGLTEDEVKKALLDEAGIKYTSKKLEDMSVEDAIAENWKWRGTNQMPTQDIQIEHYFKWLGNFARNKYKD